MADDAATAMTALQNSINRLTEQIRNMPITERRLTPNIEKQKKDKEDPAQKRDIALRTEKALEDLNKNLKEAYKKQETYGLDLKVSAKVFDNAAKKASLKLYDQIPAKLTALTKEFGMEFKTRADIDKAIAKYDLNNIEAAKALYEQLQQLTMGTAEYDAVLKKIEQRGFTDSSELAQSHEQLIDKGTKFGKSLNEVSKEVDKTTTKTGKFGIALDVAAASLALLADKLIEGIGISQKFNTGIIATAEGALALGMSQKDYGQLLHDNIQAISASGMSQEQFTEQLIASSHALVKWTGSVPESAKFLAGLGTQARRITSDLAGQSAFIEGSTKQFKQMHDTLGTTVDEFEKMNQHIMDNSDIQENLYRVTKEQRAQVVLGIQQNIQQLQTQGLLLPQAQALVDMFQNINAQSPKNRRKQAAEIAAVGGAIGLGPEAARLGELIRRGARTAAEQQEQVQLTAQIQKASQAKYAATGEGSAAETVLYELTNRAGLGGVFAQKGPAAAAGMAGGLAENKVAEKVTESNTWLAAIERWLGKIGTYVTSAANVISSILGGGLKQIIEIAVGAFTAKTIISKILTSLVGGGGKLGSLIQGGAAAAEGLAPAAATAAAETGAAAATSAATVSAAGLGAAALAVTGVAAAGAVGYGIGSLIDNYLPKLFGSDRNLSDIIGEKLAPKYDPTTTYRNYSKDAQVSQLADQYKKEEAAGHTEMAEALMKSMDAMVIAMANQDKRNPATAIDQLHKTIKSQHDENKQLTQEQIDAQKDNKKAARLVKTQPAG